MGFILTVINPNGDARVWVESEETLFLTLRETDWDSTLRVIIEKKG